MVDNIEELKGSEPRPITPKFNWLDDSKQERFEEIFDQGWLNGRNLDYEGLAPKEVGRIEQLVFSAPEGQVYTTGERKTKLFCNLAFFDRQNSEGAEEIFGLIAVPMLESWGNKRSGMLFFELEFGKNVSALNKHPELKGKPKVFLTEDENSYVLEVKSAREISYDEAIRIGGSIVKEKIRTWKAKETPTTDLVGKTTALPVSSEKKPDWGMTQPISIDVMRGLEDNEEKK